MDTSSSVTLHLVFLYEKRKYFSYKLMVGNMYVCLTLSQQCKDRNKFYPCIWVLHHTHIALALSCELIADSCMVECLRYTCWWGGIGIILYIGE